MQSIGVEYLRLIEAELRGEDIGSRSMEAPLFSSVTAKIIHDGRTLGPRYWISNLVSPVLFKSAVSEAVLDHSKDVFLEVGPHSTLAGPLRSILSKAGHTCTYVPTMLRGKDCERSFLSAIGQLYQLGLDLDFSKLNGAGTVLTNLPTYSWDRNTGRWYEPQVSRDWRFRRFGYHSLLGLRIPGTTDMEPCWRNVLSVEEETWLQDHKVLDEPIFSFGGYCAMAREAMRQIIGDSSVFTLSNIIASEAMRFTDNKPVEVRTTLRSDSHDDRDSDSRPWKFVISSYSEIGWVINCEGQLKLRQTPLAPLAPGPEELFRKVDPPSWYNALANVGFYLGPQYPQFSSIETSGGEKVARGRMSNSHSDAASVSSLHPSVLDACLVLTTVALANGLVRHVGLPIVSSVEEIDIVSGKEEMTVTVWSTDGGSTYTVEGVANDQVVLRFAGVRLTQLKTEVAKMDPGMAAQLHWLPHFEFIDPSSFFRPPDFNMEVMKLREELSLLCAIDCSERIRDLETQEPHYVKYRMWFRQEILRAQTENYSILAKDNVDALLNTRASNRSEKIEDIFKRIFAIWPEDAITMTVRLIWEKIERLFTGEEQALSVLFQDNLLIKVYNACAFDFSGVIKSMSHMNPRLRILEVGAGTGGTTATFMESLVGAGGQPGYSLYTFTDISNGFFPQAKDRFSYASNMDFKVFDISQDPFKQGFAKDTYDLIIATNVVHATPCLAETLANLHPLLAKNGRLILTELTSIMNIWSFVFGTVPGWWMGEADGRPNQPHVSLDRWDAELRAAGFRGAETVVHDAVPPYQYCTVIVSRPIDTAQHLDEGRKLTLICQKPREGVANILTNDLTKRGYLCTACELEDAVPNNGSIVSALDLEDAFFDDTGVGAYAAFQRFLSKHASQKLLWLCPPCQISCRDARFAQSIGLARTIQSKLNIPLHTLEIDPGEPDFVGLVEKVVAEVQASDETSMLLPDREYVVHNGIVHVGRYHPLSAHGQTSSRPHNAPSEDRSLEGDSERVVVVEESLSLDTTVSSAHESSSTPPSSLDSGPEDCDTSESLAKDKSDATDQELDTNSKTEKLVLDPEAAYLLIGDLDELETSFLSWLVEHGARNLVVLRGHTSGNTKPGNIVADMASLGCNLVASAGQASSFNDVERAITVAGRPIKGLIGFVTARKVRSFHHSYCKHFADLWDQDAPILEDIYDEWTAIVEPAIQEAWTLHKALINEPLQFFFLTTCLPTMLQQPVQESFDVANAFIEAFCQYRHSLGLPASVMNVATASESSKYVSQSTVLELIEFSLLNSKCAERADLYLDPHSGWTNFCHTLLNPQSLIGLSDPEQNGEIPVRYDRRLGFFHNSKTAQGDSSPSAATENALSGLLGRARTDPSILNPKNEQQFFEAALIIAHAIGMSALEFRLRQDEEVDPALSLAQMGMDSLKVIELRKWWRKALGCEVELRELTEERTLKELGKVAARRIYETIVETGK